MPDWVIPVVTVVLSSSLLVALITAPLTYRVGMRTAAAAKLTAEATKTTAETAGRKAAADVLESRTQEWQALLATANSQVATAQNLVTMVGAQNERLQSDLAALNLTHQRDIGEVKEALAECHATNRAIAERVEEVKAETRGRLTNLERGQNGA